jgi:uncharacterized protein (TIGR03032 family)
MTGKVENEVLWNRHAAEWRDPAQITSLWQDANQIDPRLIESSVKGDWWGLLEQLGMTLFITREYEHFVLALSARGGRPVISFFPIPHPSGLVVDRASSRMYLASTRNPNQILTLKPAAALLPRTDTKVRVAAVSPLVPISTDFYPGSLYIHDLAIVGGGVHANAVGHNAVVKLDGEGDFRRVWWPKCVERDGKPVFEKNHIQLNSIAAGKTLKESYFSASSCRMGRLRPGHLNYKVDRQGVIFSGRTREPFCSGLTRPHSARLWGDNVWVANSGYGEVGYARQGLFESVCRLPGWTRGLCLTEGIAFAGTSRVIPRYARYAPGVDTERSRCGIHAICLRTGGVLGSIEWPTANQIFAIDWISDRVSPGFLFQSPKRKLKEEMAFFYRYLSEPKSANYRSGAK